MKYANINSSPQFFLRLPSLLILCFITLAHMARARESHIMLFMREAGNCRNMIDNHIQENVMSCFNNATRLTPSNYLMGEVFENIADVYYKAEETKLTRQYLQMSANKRILAIMHQEQEVDYIKQAIAVLSDQKDEGKMVFWYELLGANLMHYINTEISAIDLFVHAIATETLSRCEQELQNPSLQKAYRLLWTLVKSRQYELLDDAHQAMHVLNEAMLLLPTASLTQKSFIFHSNMIRERQDALLNTLGIKGYGVTPLKDGQIIPAPKRIMQEKIPPGRQLAAGWFEAKMKEGRQKENKTYVSVNGNAM